MRCESSGLTNDIEIPAARHGFVGSRDFLLCGLGHLADVLLKMLRGLHLENYYVTELWSLKPML